MSANSRKARATVARPQASERCELPFRWQHGASVQLASNDGVVHEASEPAVWQLPRVGIEAPAPHVVERPVVAHEAAWMTSSGLPEGSSISTWVPPGPSGGSLRKVAPRVSSPATTVAAAGRRFLATGHRLAGGSAKS